MPKTYILKKPLPWHEVGTEWQVLEGGASIAGISMQKIGSSTTQTFPRLSLHEWFEEKDGRWKPKDRESYFVPNLAGEVISFLNNSTFDSEIIAFGGAFRTSELAEGFLPYLKEALDKYHSIIGE